MKKRYRRVRYIWVGLVGLLSVLCGLYGLLTHGSLEGKIAIVAALGLFTLYIYLGCNRWEVK